MATAAHGSAVALIGVDADVQGFSLADGTAQEPCVQLSAPISGALVLGINDTDVVNNSGEFLFEVMIDTPATMPRPQCPTRSLSDSQAL